MAYLLCAQHELARRNKNMRYSPRDGGRDSSSLWREQWDVDTWASIDCEAHGVCCLSSSRGGSRKGGLELKL